MIFCENLRKEIAMEELQQQVEQLIENASEAVSHHATEVAMSIQDQVDGESILDMVLEIGSFVVEAISD